MKKYPYSNKAIKAMLVASLAFTPLVGFSTVKAEAATVEYSASTEDSINALIERLDAVYDQLSDDDRIALQAARDNLDTVNWEEYASDISKEGSGNIDAKSELLQALVELTFSNNVETLKANIETFRDTQAENVDTVFGADVTVDKLLNFIADVENQFLLNITGLNLTTITETRFWLEFADAMLVVGDTAGTDNNKVYTALTNEVDLIATQAALREITNIIDPDQKARAAFINAVKKVQPEPGFHFEDGILAINNPDTIAKKPTAIIDVIKDASDFTALEISVKGDTISIELPQTIIEALKEKNADATIVVSNEVGSYTLPVSEINLTSLANALAINVEDVKIGITVAPGEDTANVINTNGLNAVAPIMEFSVVARSEDGKTVPVKAKFSTFIEGTITGEDTFNANQSIAVRLNDNGTFSAIPTLFKDNTATIKSLSNSEYTIVQNNKTFTDVNNGKNWAEAHIEKLASKYIVNGKTEAIYAPSQDITRGEFAALISRSLGLVAENPKEVKFSDVPANKAVNKNGEINAAVEAGIILGIGAGEFAPDRKITRADAAIMIGRAMNYTKVPDSKLDKTKKITSLKDHASIGPASRASIEKVVQAGIMSGFGNGQFGPNHYTKRDQMAKVIDEFLQVSEFTN